MGLPIEEADQFGFQDPPSLSRLGGLDATVTDVLEEGGLGDPQVLAGFLSCQNSIFFTVIHCLSRLTGINMTCLEKCIFYANIPLIKKYNIFSML
jgi:hypothetical protein